MGFLSGTLGSGVAGDGAVKLCLDAKRISGGFGAAVTGVDFCDLVEGVDFCDTGVSCADDVGVFCDDTGVFCADADVV